MRKVNYERIFWSLQGSKQQTWEDLQSQQHDEDKTRNRITDNDVIFRNVVNIVLGQKKHESISTTTTTTTT